MSQDARSVPAARATSSSTSLRAWQVRALDALRDWRGGPFLVSAAPGAGKTRPALELARRLLRERQVARVALVCPTAPLTRQWAVAAARLGVHLVPDAETPRPPTDFDGVAVTYARVAMAGERWSRLVSPGTLVIADEAHHLGEDLAWGDGFATAFAAAPRWLLLSGTPFRSDATPIPGVRYDRAGVAEPDVTYTYADAVRDGICRPVSFVTYDGTLSWRSGDDVIESTFDTVLTGREASRRYRTAISTELPDGLPRILREAHERLLAVRAGGHGDAGGLVIAADGAHAREVARLLREATGRAPAVVLHTEARAAQKLADFTASRDPWLVAVNMVSEGVDIPRLRVGVYATAAKTPLIFRQIVGRFVRTLPGRPVEPSWLYLPADPVLRGHAAEIQTELRHVLRRPGDEDGVLDEPRERRQTERGEPEGFMPVAADVVPQMTLFGPPPGAPGGPVALAVAAMAAVAAAGVGDPPAGGEDAGDGPALPAYQRRALLRDKRHRLVADLRRLDGRSHAEINAWLNRACGVGKVGEATIEQLERSIELLLGELTARR
jgi:superfamily II DNA or RNA helicase